MDKDVYKCDLSSDYLLALNNILKRTRRKTASKEELARELNMPLSEIEIPCSYLVEYGYAFPDDSDRFEIYDFGTLKNTRKFMQESPDISKIRLK